MSSNMKNRTRLRGQSLPLVGLLLAAGVLIGFLAIAIDGGSALLQRRTMQNGADAAALAAINLMSGNVFQTCVPSPCHPTYGLTNSNVNTKIVSLSGNNRGGAVGATPANYGVSFAYHFMPGAPSYSNAYGPTVTDMSALVPAFADGLVVTNTVANPTIFVRALPSRIVGTQLTSMTITAYAAGRIYATCPPAPQPGHTLPFTRFFPAIQWEILRAGNDPTHPFPLWSSNSDIQNDGQFKNMISLSKASFTGGQQLISQFDERNGNSVPFEDGSLCHYGNNCSGGLSNPYSDCVNLPGSCADMRGSPGGNNDSTDIADDVFWRWRGLIDVGHEWISGRPGDWAETYHIGDSGNNIHQPLIDLFNYVPQTAPGGPAPGPLSGPPLNLGPAITMTIFMWGNPWDNYPSNYSDNSTYAQFRNTCPGGNNNCGSPVWDDLQITGGLQGQGFQFKISDSNVNGNNIQLDRVRFTKYFTMVFYKQTIIDGGNSQVNGFILSPNSPGPNPGNCGWQAGGGVYSGQVSYP